MKHNGELYSQHLHYKTKETKENNKLELSFSLQNLVLQSSTVNWATEVPKYMSNCTVSLCLFLHWCSKYHSVVERHLQLMIWTEALSFNSFKTLSKPFDQIQQLRICYPSTGSSNWETGCTRKAISCYIEDGYFEPRDAEQLHCLGNMICESIFPKKSNTITVSVSENKSYQMLTLSGETLLWGK